MNRATDISYLPLVFSVPEAAQLIGIGKNTMYYIIKEGQIPCIRIGRQIRISRTALLKYLGIDQSAKLDHQRKGGDFLVAKACRAKYCL